MYQRSITYTDFNDVERTETIFFNLSKAELSKMASSEGGGFAARMQRMMDAKNITEIVDTVMWLIDQSYGIKTDDGRYFRKDKKYLDDFKSSPLYDEFWMALMNEENTMSDFIVGVMPKDMQAEIKIRVSNKLIELGGETQDAGTPS